MEIFLTIKKKNDNNNPIEQRFEDNIKLLSNIQKWITDNVKENEKIHLFIYTFSPKQGGMANLNEMSGLNKIIYSKSDYYSRGKALETIMSQLRIRKLGS